MALSFVGYGAVAAVATAAAPAYPTGIAAGDLLLLYISTDAAVTIPAQTGWTPAGPQVAGGGITAGLWWKTAVGTETGTFTTTGTITGGTKGLAWIKAFHSSTGATIGCRGAVGTDTDTTTTAFSAASSTALSALVGDIVECAWTALAAAAGAFSASPTGQALAISGATATATARFGGRSGTNTIAYTSIDAAVTAVTNPTTATASATIAGANAGGAACFALIYEIDAAAASQAVTSAVGGAVYGAAASYVAGLNDTDDTTGSSLNVGDAVVLGMRNPLTIVSGQTTKVDLRLTGPATYSAQMYYDQACTSSAAAAQSTTLAGAGPTDWAYVLTAGEETALTTHTGLFCKVTRTA